jgi:hypothetical protein
MGKSCSKTRNNQNDEPIRFTDYNKVKIPDGYKLIKLATYNVSLRNGINVKPRIDDIVNFIFSNFKNKGIDIICLQGIYDYNLASSMVKQIKNRENDMGIKFHFAPDFDDVTAESSQHTSRKPKSKSRSKTDSKKMKVQNIIISQHPIVSTIFGEIDDENDFDDVIGTHTIISANISIVGNIISVHNTYLSKDIRTANIVNSDIRESELMAVFDIIMQNRENLRNIKDHMKTDAEFLVGAINVNEMNGDELNEEFTNIISNRHLVDIFRYLNDDNYGYTNTTDERLNYIFIILTDDMYSDDSQFKQRIESLDTEAELLDIIFERFGIYFLDSYVRNDINIQGRANNYPVESIFMMKV